MRRRAFLAASSMAILSGVSGCNQLTFGKGNPSFVVEEFIHASFEPDLESLETLIHEESPLRTWWMDGVETDREALEATSVTVEQSELVVQESDQAIVSYEIATSIPDDIEFNALDPPPSTESWHFELFHEDQWLIWDQPPSRTCLTPDLGQEVSFNSFTVRGETYPFEKSKVFRALRTETEIEAVLDDLTFHESDEERIKDEAPAIADGKQVMVLIAYEEAENVVIQAIDIANPETIRIHTCETNVPPRSGAQIAENSKLVTIESDADPRPAVEGILRLQVGDVVEFTD